MFGKFGLCDPKYDGQIDRLRKKYFIPELPESVGADDYYLDQVRSVVKETATKGSDPWPLPSSAIAIPTGFGAEWGEVFAGGSITSPITGGARYDGAGVVGFGLGKAKVVALEVSLNAYSIIPPFRSGDLTLKLHHIFPFGLGISAGREGLIQWNSSTASNFFVAASKYFLISNQEDDWFSLIILHLGAGNGRYNLANVVDDQVVSEANWSVFFGSSVRLKKFLTFNVNWTGRNVVAGFGVTPFKTFPLNFGLSALDVFRQTIYGLRFSVAASTGFRF